MLGQAGIDAELFSAHSTRCASPSKGITSVSTDVILATAQVTQAHCERSAYNNLLIFAYFISRQNIRVCMENATKTL